MPLSNDPDQVIVDRETLIRWVADARRRTAELVADLPDEQLLGPKLEIVNPLLWELGRVAWFQEKWVLRGVLGQAPARPNVDALYDSSAVAHARRWDLPLPPRDETLAYLREVRDRVIEALQRHRLTPPLAYHVQYSVFHEDMHAEAFMFTRQTFGYPAPNFSGAAGNESSIAEAAAAPLDPEDVEIPACEFLLGALDDGAFVFDNERLSPLSGIHARSLPRIFAAVVRRPEGASGRLLGDALAADPHHLEELLHARPARRLGRLSDLRSWRLSLACTC